MTKEIFQTYYKKVQTSLINRLGIYLKHRVIGLQLQWFQKTHWPKQPLERSFEKGIAVIVPCYNHAAYLEATFTCLAQQTYRPFEVIFIEDHSSDDSYNRLKRFSAELPLGIKTTLLQTPKNSGQAFAINLGVEMAHASICMVLNDDDYLMHDTLEATIEILAHHSNLFLFGATCKLFQGYGCPADEEGKLIRNIYPSYTSIPLIKYTPTNAVHFAHPNDLNMTHSGTTFFKSAWQAVGGYYASRLRRIVIYSDRDFQLRVAALFPVAVSMEVPFGYWRDGSSVDQGLNS